MPKDEVTKINPRLLQGFRDFLPEKKMQRDWLIAIVQEVYESFGFLPLETPTLEYADILTGKYGEEGNRLMYRFEDNGGRKVAMRFDLTVPFSRVIAQYPDLPKPFKRYQVAPVWRGESTQKGRYREFYQFDADIAGSSSMLADAEIVCLIYTVMTKLGIRNFAIQISNRKVLNGLVEYAGISAEKTNSVFTAIDKLQKIGPEGVRDELLAAEITTASAEKVMDFLKIGGTNEIVLSKLKKLFTKSTIGLDGVAELEEVVSYLDNMGVEKASVKIDPSVARGLDYYTGTVFETTLLDLPKFGSVFSGGRFDAMIGMFTGKDVPAVGASVGVDRLFSAMEELKLLPETKSMGQVLVTVFPENIDKSLTLAGILREADINTEVYLGENANFKSQLRYANKQKIPIVVITFPDQTEKDIYIIKEMENGEQHEVPLEDVAKVIQELL